MGKQRVKYFHELTKADRKKMGKQTWGEIKKRYHQPPWCQYPGALGGDFGCWSLTSDIRDQLSEDGVITEDFCKTCDFYKEVK